MKHTQQPRGSSGFTLIELLVVVAVIGILASLYLPVMARAKSKAKHVQCVSNLHQIGVAFRMFAGEHEGRYPAAVRARYGGVVESAGSGGAYRHFQALAGSLDSPWLLLCPTDRLRHSTNWAALTDENVSYLVGMDAQPNNQFHILAADRNITNRVGRTKPVMQVAAESRVEWTPALHGREGNLLFADGRVEFADDRKLAQAIRQHRQTN